MNRRGNIVIALAFVLLLSFSGLALLTHSLLHTRIIQARRSKWQASTALEQALLLHVHGYGQRLRAVDLNLFSAPENDFFNCTNFPDVDENGVLVKNSFGRQPQLAGNGFSKLKIINHLAASKENSRLRGSGQASVDLLAGNIPLNEFSLLLHHETNEPAAAYLAKKGVELAGTLLPLTDDSVPSGDCRQVLTETLRLEGSFPDWRRMREKFNLEAGDEPIPRGVYLALGAGVVEAVFIEGDLEKLEFAAAGTRQKIVFWLANRPHELGYLPGSDSLTWNGEEAVTGCQFREKIFIHGNLWAVQQSAAAAFADGTRLQVMASGRIVIATGLVGLNPGLASGRFSNLLLMTCSRDFFSGMTVNADIVFETSGDAVVEAHLLADGKVINGRGLIKLSGSLVAGDIENSGRMQIQSRPGAFDFPAALSLQNFKCLQNFRIDFITEGNDE